MNKEIIAPIAEVGGSLISSAVGYISARKQEKFQEMMSNTAHQREVADLKAAGINPIFTATGGHGATTPVGTSVSPENPLRGMTQNVLKYKELKQQNRLIDSEIMKNEGAYQASSAAAQREIADANFTDAQRLNYEIELNKKIAETKSSSAQAVLLAEKNLTEKANRLLIQSEKELNVLERTRLNEELKKIKADMKVYESKFGKAIPWIENISNIINKVKSTTGKMIPSNRPRVRPE